MRRRWTGALLSAALVTAGWALTACGSAPKAAADPNLPNPASQGQGPASASQAASSPGPGSVPLVANRHAVCGVLNTAIATAAKAFGTDLGSVVGHVAAGNTSAAATSRSSAHNRLVGLARAIRSTARSAVDAGVRVAAVSTAANIDVLANQSVYLAGVRTRTDATLAIKVFMAASDPLNSACV